MPLDLDPRPSAEASRRPAGRYPAPPGQIVVGLVNNMPDTALEATEQQFAALLGTAAGAYSVRLRLSYLPEVPRGAAALEHVQRSYWRIEELFGHPLDALIVTGTEPRAASLCEEPYWQRFGQLLGWAERHTISSVWSCLAAHAAVQLLDGIERCRLPDKLFGVFEHAIAATHPITQGLTAPLPMPHSRWNDLPIASLREAGYEILSWCETTGADLFVKQRDSLLVFFQGHPEYQRTTLFREYRRDVVRYLNGQQSNYPPLPPHYLTPHATELLQAFRQRAELNRNPEVFTGFPGSAAEDTRNDWQTGAVRIYANWLSLIGSVKTARSDGQRAAGV